jgi:hypothetical protein
MGRSRAKESLIGQMDLTMRESFSIIIFKDLAIIFGQMEDGMKELG